MLDGRRYLVFIFYVTLTLSLVVQAGGPVYDIPKGRKDGTQSKIEDTINLPPPTLNSTELIKMFGQHGFTAQEMVALSGQKRPLRYKTKVDRPIKHKSKLYDILDKNEKLYDLSMTCMYHGAGGHTLGVARCSSFKNRLKSFDATHDVDPSIDTQFVKTLAKTCSAGDNAEQPFDMSRNTFDNDYYNMIQRQAGVLSSDQTLLTNPRTRAIVNGYAMNQAMFFFDFQRAMVKMGLLDVKENGQGQVRQDCRKNN